MNQMIPQEHETPDKPHHMHVVRRRSGAYYILPHHPMGPVLRRGCDFFEILRPQGTGMFLRDNHKDE